MRGNRDRYCECTVGHKLRDQPYGSERAERNKTVLKPERIRGATVLRS